MNLQPTFQIYRANVQIKKEISKLQRVFDLACEVVNKHYAKPFEKMFDNKTDTDEVFYRRIIIYLVRTQNFKYKDIEAFFKKKYYKISRHHIVEGFTITIHWLLYAKETEQGKKIIEIENEFNKQLYR